MTVLLNETRLREEHFTMIAYLVEKACQARKKRERIIKETLDRINIELPLHGEPCTDPKRSLASVRQLECISKLADSRIAECRGVANSAMQRRSQLKKRAMDAARKEIESW